MHGRRTAICDAIFVARGCGDWWRLWSRVQYGDICEPEKRLQMVEIFTGRLLVCVLGGHLVQHVLRLKNMQDKRRNNKKPAWRRGRIPPP
jgi:hypothetical protein